MKKIYSLFLLMLFAIVGAGQAWAEEYKTGEVDVTTLAEGDIVYYGVTLTGASSNGYAFYKSETAWAPDFCSYEVNYRIGDDGTDIYMEYLPYSNFFDEESKFKFIGKNIEYQFVLINDDVIAPVNFSLLENNCYYSTFYSDDNWIVPENVDACVVYTLNGKEVSLEVVGHENQVIEGGNAVILRLNNYKPASVSINRTSNPVNTTIDKNQNLLHGTEYGMADFESESGYVYYILSKVNGVPGFYWQNGSDKGDKVKVGAHKAYLRVQKNEANSNGLSIRFDDTLTSIMNAATNENATYYNLQGQRVNKSMPVGVYIKNGKKYIVR